MDRRRYLVGSTMLFAGVVGCVSDEEGASPDPVAEDGPASYLPESTDGWTYRGRKERTVDWEPLGASDGVVGQYTGPDGVSYEFVVMATRPQYARGSARSLACAGWQVALVVEDTALAASSGTEQRAFTPEAPPTMTGSPVPGEADRARELLALSPQLAEPDVDANRIACEQ